jgi:bis(5'-nucleosidyl)-tetraphosphatase
MRKSCGVFVLKVGKEPSFLLLRTTKGTWDLPKGKVEDGESELECAVRELFEETRLPVERLSLDPTFRFQTTVKTKSGDKRVVVFLAVVEDGAQVRCADHDGFEWVPWRDRRPLGAATIDAVVEAVDAHLAA